MPLRCSLHLCKLYLVVNPRQRPIWVVDTFLAHDLELNGGFDFGEVLLVGLDAGVDHIPWLFTSECAGL